MTEDQWKAVVMAIVNEADYDIYKQLLPECNEYGPEEASIFMDQCIKAGQEAVEDPQKWLKDLK